MNGKQKTDHRTDKNRKEYRQLRQKSYGMIILLAAVCCLFGGLIARYIHQSVTDPGQITSDNFYFTANLLGDTNMVKTDGTSEETYAFTEQSTEGTWYLYGSGVHAIQINVQNFYDSLRVTDADITYETSVEVTDAAGNTISVDDALMPTVTKDTDTANDTANTEKATGNSYLLKTNADKSAAKDVQTLTIPEHTKWNYADGTTVTLKITSTSPYKKTLTMHFVLYAVDTTLSYEVVDTVGSPYASLILMTNVTSGNESTGIRPVLQWPEELDIDNSNALTFQQNTDGTFVPVTGMTERNMQVSQDLATGRSETIYFFKTDTSKNYSRKQTVVKPSTNGTYVINLGTE